MFIKRKSRQKKYYKHLLYIFSTWENKECPSTYTLDHAIQQHELNFFGQCQLTKILNANARLNMLLQQGEMQIRTIIKLTKERINNFIRQEITLRAEHQVHKEENIVNGHNIQQ